MAQGETFTSGSEKKKWKYDKFYSGEKMEESPGGAP